jgi:acylglycerol lipase
VRATSGHLPTADLRLPTRSWLPDAPASAAVLLVHGLGEHVGRYDALATRLVASGYAVYGYDQRGHGYAPGPRCQVRRFTDLIDDAGAAGAWVREQQPRLPFVLMGHSLGGVVALRAVQTGALAPDALVLSSPALRDGVAVPALLRRLLARLAGPFPNLPTVRIDVAGLSRDPAAVAAYVQDPAVYHGPLKARIAPELERHGALALAEADRVRLPVLLLHGKADALALPSASGALHRSLAGRDATLRLYDDGPHELFHDPLAPRVTADLLTWLAERVPSAKPAGRS